MRTTLSAYQIQADYCLGIVCIFLLELNTDKKKKKNQRSFQ